jgi:hypothetical protein
MVYAPREQLYNLFLVYFSEPANDNIDDEQVVYTMAKEISPNSLSLIKNEICNLKQEVPFPWRELGKASNRYFESDVDAYEWLDEVLLALMKLGL